MKLVIKISDEDYKAIAKGYLPFGAIADAIINGTPLPEHHGRLIDASYLLNLLKCEEHKSCTWKNCSDCNREKCIKKYEILKAPTIIEADMGNDNE